MSESYIIHVIQVIPSPVSTAVSTNPLYLVETGERTVSCITKTSFDKFMSKKKAETRLRIAPDKDVADRYITA